MIEIWKDVVRFEGFYQISSYGNVRSLDRVVIRRGFPARLKGQILKFNNHSGGYLQIHLKQKSIDCCYYVHRLVAQAFIPNPKQLPEVRAENRKI